MLSVVDIALARAPLFRQIESQIVEIEPLGSLTNLSYKLTTSMGSYVLRLPGEDTFDYIDRRAEEHNGRITASVGINAKVLHVDAEDGTMLSRFIEGMPMNGGGFERDPMAPARAALVLRRVHRLGPVFRSRFDVFSMIRGYLEILYKLRMPPPEDYYEVEREAEAVRRVLQASPVGLAPCHNDPWPGNFVVDSGGGIHLIDWEFSGMNDPMWDLGDLSVEAGFGPEQDWTMMEAYCGGYAHSALYARLELYKALSDLLWSLWGLIQYANGNPSDEFLPYAQGRLERCKARIGSEDFGRHLTIVATRWEPSAPAIASGRLESFSIAWDNRTGGKQMDGGCQPPDDSLSHVPDVEARRIVRTAPGIEKGLGSSRLRPGRPP
jgi:thiamine kinase-like enzyme